MWHSQEVDQTGNEVTQETQTFIHLTASTTRRNVLPTDVSETKWVITKLSRCSAIQSSSQYNYHQSTDITAKLVIQLEVISANERVFFFR